VLDKLNQFLDVLSGYLAQRKGLLPMFGAFLVIVNGILQFTPFTGWFVESDLLLHLGIIIAIFGFLLAWAL
jgi:hypothetical protein